MVSTVLVVDGRSRERKVFSASATRLESNAQAIILRKAVEIGTVSALHGKTVESPIIVVGEYQAKSSAGYVTVLGGEKFLSIVWVGGAGFPGGLKPFGYPVKGTIVPAGCRVDLVQVHHNSNPATAEAALKGLSLRAQLNGSLYLVEGQSDCTSATSFEVQEDAEAPEFPEEHRSDIFSTEKMLDTVVRRIVRGDEGRKALIFAIMRAAYRAGKDADFIGIPPVIREILGNEEIKRIVEERVASMEAEGWKFGYDMSLSNHFTRTISPDGKETGGDALFREPEVEESFLELSTLNSEEEKRNMRTSNLSNRLSLYFWEQWAVVSLKKGSVYDSDKLVEAEFTTTPTTRLWFAEEGKRLGPNGEPNNGGRFLSAFDAKGYHLWDRLLEVRKLTVTAYSREGQIIDIRIWESN